MDVEEIVNLLVVVNNLVAVLRIHHKKAGTLDNVYYLIEMA